MPKTSAICLAAAVLFLCGSFPPAEAATLLPDFSAATFTPGAAINNPFFPALPGVTQTYAARTPVDGGILEERSILSTQGSGPQILGVGTTTQRDQAYANGLLMEDTFDYYAQDTAGNVWYMGEDVTSYTYDGSGNLIDTSHASTWRAGVNGALPGFIMPAQPSLGLAYFQEHAPEDQALDEALVYALDQTIKVGDKTYTGVLVTFESSSLDPDLRELKYYAPGVGLIRADEGVDANFANPKTIFTLSGGEPAPVPLPAGALLLAGGLAVVAIARRTARRRRA